MKNRDLSLLKKVGLTLCLGMILQPDTSFSQCLNNLGTRTYDTTLTSNGFNIFSLSFPKWSPDSGLLVSVKLSAEVSSQYGFTLRNMDPQPATYQLTIGQQDQFISPQLSSPLTHLSPARPFGTFPLMPGQAVTQAPFTLLDKQVLSDSITTVAPFLGKDQVSISYMSFTYTSLSTINNATYSYGATIANTMRFSLQYLYCNGAGLLATGLTRWEASLEEPRTVRLDWSVVNEAPGRHYHVQRSSDGQQFMTIATLPATTNGDGNYTWSDLPAGSPGAAAGPIGGNFYYRLQIEDNGSMSYSAVRQVSITGNRKDWGIYPNPAVDFINITPGQGATGSGKAAAGNWQVDILSANGSLIQRETFLQTRTMHVVFRSRLSSGTYFVRITDLHGQTRFTGSFITTGGR